MDNHEILDALEAIGRFPADIHSDAEHFPVQAFDQLLQQIQ